MKIQIKRSEIKARKFVPASMNRPVSKHRDKRFLSGRKAKHKNAVV